MNIDPSGNTSLGEMVTTLAAMPEVQCISIVVLTCLFGALAGVADAYYGGGDKNEIIQGALKGISAAALLGCIVTTIAFFIPLAPLIAACALFAVDAVLITFGAIGVVVSIKEGKPLQAIFRGMMLAVAVVFGYIKIKDLNTYKPSYEREDGIPKYDNSESDTYQGSTKSAILAQNRANGRAFEQQEFSKFSSQNKNAVEQVTVKTTSGIKTRVDAIGLDSNGNIVINEFKSSLTAPLTDNQKLAFPEIFESGATVVGKGKGIFTGGYQIPPGTKVTIIRPE